MKNLTGYTILACVLALVGCALGLAGINAGWEASDVALLTVPFAGAATTVIGRGKA